MELLGYQERVGFRLRGFPLLPAAITALVAFFLFINVWADLRDCFAGPLWRHRGLGIYLVAIPITLIGVALPLLFALRLVLRTVRHSRSDRGTAQNRFVQIVGLLLIVLCMYIPFWIVEGFYPLSAVPLSTAICGVLCVPLAYLTTRSFPVTTRLTLAAIVVAVILVVKFVDWNSNKPFARDLYRVHEGMSGQQVEAIMGGHLKNFVEPESEHYRHLESGFSGDVIYRHSQGAAAYDSGLVKFENGLVVDVEICLCD